jgi:hypothetical protein
MKYYVSQIIPRLSSFSKKLDKIAAICDRKWTIVDGEDEPTTYIFRDKNELLMVKGGVVKKAKWDVVNKDDIVIEQNEEILMFKQAFIDENIFVLNLFNTNNYLHLVDSEKVVAKTIKELENILNKRYLVEKSKPSQSVENTVCKRKEEDNNLISETMLKEGDQKKVNMVIYILFALVFGISISVLLFLIFYQVL